MVDKPAPDPAFEALLRHIQESRGLDFRGYKRTSLRRRIVLRMEAIEASDFGDYQSRLEADPGEFENLLNTVLINVTSFFRDPEAWDVLRSKVAPGIVTAAGDASPIRIWSVGCASGEEPYSLAMIFAELLGARAFCERVKIYATDLDEEALSTARQASYSPRQVEGVPPELLERYFERTKNHYVFNRELRKCVIFGRHNVVRDAPISRVNLLVCRNLLIYLEAETQDVVLPRLHYALAPDGVLFLGKAETQLARSPLFRSLDARHRLFTKVPQEWRRNPGSTVLASPGDASGLTGEEHVRLAEAVLNEARAAYLVVDDAGRLVLVNAAARRLLSVGEADIGRPFQDLPISYRPVELRAPMETVLRERRSLRIEDQELQTARGDIYRLSVELRPLFGVDGAPFGVCLAFQDTTETFVLRRELATAQESLENTIEELQSANEELETTNEELQSTNEELETTNEELQSSNEELETINEEMRSTADEMESVNEALQVQAEQASLYRLHLESVLRGLNIGVIVVDRRMTVESWNRWNEQTWGLKAEDAVGVSLEALDIGFPIHRLRDAVSAVQSGRAERAAEILEGVDRRGRSLRCRVRVFALLSSDDDPAGAVLAFEDVTDAERKDEYADYLGRVMGRAINEIYFLDPLTLHFRLTSASAEKRLGYGAALTRMAVTDVMPKMELERLRGLIEPVMNGHSPEAVFETTIRPADGVDYEAEVSLQYFSQQSPPILLAVVHKLPPPGVSAG